MRGKQFKKLMREIQRNPEEGLRKFYETYARIIQATAQSVCHSKDKINEVVDDVLVKIWKLAPTVGEIKNPEGWIYIITLNTAKDTIKEPYVFPLEENILSGRDGVQELIDKDSFEWLIKNLSPQEQTVIIQKFILSYTFQEIANELGKPLTTVCSIYYRSLEKIKKEIENNQYHA